MLSQFRPSYSTIYGVALVAQLASFLVSSLQLNNFILEGVSNVIMSALMSPTHSMDGQNVCRNSTQSAICRNSNVVIIKMLSYFWPPCSTICGVALDAQLASFLESSLQLNNLS